MASSLVSCSPRPQAFTFDDVSLADELDALPFVDGDDQFRDFLSAFTSRPAVPTGQASGSPSANLSGESSGLGAGGLEGTKALAKATKVAPRPVWPALRCMDGSHARSCKLCSAPPAPGTEGAYELRGDPGKVRNSARLLVPWEPGVLLGHF